MHVHMESESHFARVAAIKRLYQDPPPEKQPTDMKQEPKNKKKGTDVTRVANERQMSSPVKEIKVYVPKQKPKLSSE